MSPRGRRSRRPALGPQPLATYGGREAMRAPLATGRHGPALLAALLFAALAVPARADPVRVSRKVDTETAILEQIAAQHLTRAGVPADAGRALGGTPLLFDALDHRRIDCYPEYTGTVAVQILHRPDLKTVAALRPVLAERHIGITESLGFDDTYALGMTEARAAALGVRTIGDLARHPDLRLGLSTEFAGRADGWPGVRAAYRLPDLPVAPLAHEFTYPGLLAGRFDVADLYSTDAEIAQHHLRVLADDRHFFPAYQAVFLYRLELPAKTIAALRQLEGTLDADRMRAMNAAVKVDGRSPEAVATDYLTDYLTGTATAGPSLAARVWRLTLEHLFLVAVSLSAAIAVAIPLGVAAAEFPRFGHAVIVVVAGLYTIPSLALLAFLIPAVGIGWRPAVLALFVYSLLPIVRNTQAGLRAIPPQLRESADVLGLSRWARLRHVGLPMASPSILAGIKTAAVLNVGTATLGGFIAAGGYGQAIFDGITFTNTRLLLTGAIPAAVMALAIQAGFDLLEPLVVPRGLRLRPAAE